MDTHTFDLGIVFIGYNIFNVIALDLKVVSNDGNVFHLFHNKMIRIKNEIAVWAGSAPFLFAKPSKVMVEICGNGKLLYVNSFSTANYNQENIIFINPNVCWRTEDPDTISIFNTNGNLLFLRGIYLDIWEQAKSAVLENELEKILLMKGHDLARIKSALSSLMNRNLILKQSIDSI